MAARYWRLLSFVQLSGTVFTLSEISAFSGASSIAVTPTSSDVPIAGSLADLTDGNPSTYTSWLRLTAEKHTFTISLDAGVDVDLTRLEAVDSLGRRLQAVVQYQESGVWVTAFLTVGDTLWHNALRLLPFTVGKPVNYDAVGETTTRWTIAGAPVIDTLSSPFASSPGSLNPNSGLLYGPGLGWGTGDLTVETHIRLDTLAGTSVANDKIIYGAFSSFLFFVRYGSGSLRLFDNTIDVGGGVVPVGVWCHVALVRASGVLTLYLDGQNVLRTAWTKSFAADTVAVGRNFAAVDRHFQGRIKDMRISNVARYRDNFVPSAEPSPVPEGPFQGSSFSEVVASTAELGPVGTVVDSDYYARDMEFGGNGKIWGTTKIKGLLSNEPTKARVVLMHQRSKLVVRETWSHPTTGYFAFDGVDLAQQFITYAEDAAGGFRPVAANRLVPKVA